MLPLHARILLAARQAHAVGVNGVAERAAGYDQIGFIDDPQYFMAGTDNINLVMIGKIAEGYLIIPRGTLSPGAPDSASDWLEDCDAVPVEIPGYPGYIHQGFHDAWNDVRPRVLSALPPDIPRIIGGHSKGGAVAPLIAWEFRDKHPTVCTFAAPRCGDATFVSAYNAALPGSVRYEYGNDLVPHLPPTVPLPGIGGTPRAYEPVGTLCFIDWTGNRRSDSQGLSWQRGLALAELLLSGDFSEFAAAHSIDPGSGYATAVGLVNK